MIFVLNRVRVWGATLHLPTQGYIEYPPSPRGGCHCHYFIIVFASVTASNYLHVICKHFIWLTPLFKGHVACWNFTLREPLLWQFGMLPWFIMCFYLMTGHLLGGKRLITWASLLASLHLAATLSSSVLFLPPKATLQPSLDNKRTAPRPIPELPPETYFLVSSMVKTYVWKLIFRIKEYNSIIILSL